MSSNIEARTEQAASGGITGTVFESNGELLVHENQTLVESSLSAVRANLSAKPAWKKAPAPTDDFLLMFLRAEAFNAEKAAQRYRQFWKMKVSLWGEDKAHMPIESTAILKALKTGFVQIVSGTKDREGRQVILITETKNNRKIPRNERGRAFWYTIFAALEDVDIQRRGICIMLNFKGSRFSSVELKFILLVLESLQNVLPVRLGTMNVVYPPSFFSIVWNMTSPFMSKKFQQKVRVIPEANTLHMLDEVVEVAGIPEPMGPKKLDLDSWVAQRVESDAQKES